MSERRNAGGTGILIALAVMTIAVIAMVVGMVNKTSQLDEEGAFQAYDAGTPDSGPDQATQAADSPDPEPSGVQAQKTAAEAPTHRQKSSRPSPDSNTAPVGGDLAKPSGAVADKAIEGADTEARGQLDRDDIMAGVKEITPFVKACYEEVLVDFPDAAGTVVMEFDIIAENGAGRVEMSKLNQEKTTLYDTRLHNCMLESIGDVNFDIPSGGGKVSVKYPFKFTNEPED